MTDVNSRRWVILAVVTLVAFITNVDATIVIVGLPNLVKGLHTTIVSGMWTITSYSIASTVFLLPAGRWSDIIGVKRIFLWGLVVFTIATILCGFADSIAALNVYRFIQGIGAALSLATATPSIAQAFPQKELGRALGINTTFWVLGSLIGPVAGGVLINAFGWRSVFFVTAPIALIGIVSAWFVLKDTTERLQAKNDLIGIFTFGLGLCALLVALSEGQGWGWSSGPIVGLFAGTFILWITFAVVELRVKDPLFDLRLLSHRRYTIGLAIMLFYGAGFFAITFLLTLYLQNAQHLSPMEAGLLLLPMSLPQLFLSPLSGAAADRFGPERLILTGLVLLGVSVILLGNLGVNMSIAWVVIPQLLISTGNALAFPALVKAVLSAAPREQSGVAYGMFYTVRFIGVSLSQAIALLVGEFSVPSNIASKVFFGMHSVNAPLLAGTLVHAIDAGFRSFIIFFVISIVFGFYLMRSQRREKVFSRTSETA